MALAGIGCNAYAARFEIQGVLGYEDIEVDDTNFDPGGINLTGAFLVMVPTGASGLSLVGGGRMSYVNLEDEDGNVDRSLSAFSLGAEAGASFRLSSVPLTLQALLALDFALTGEVEAGSFDADLDSLNRYGLVTQVLYRAGSQLSIGGEWAWPLSGEYEIDGDYGDSEYDGHRLGVVVSYAL